MTFLYSMRSVSHPRGSNLDRRIHQFAALKNQLSEYVLSYLIYTTITIGSQRLATVLDLFMYYHGLNRSPLLMVCHLYKSPGSIILWRKISQLCCSNALIKHSLILAERGLGSCAIPIQWLMNTFGLIIICYWLNISSLLMLSLTDLMQRSNRMITYQLRCLY